MWFWWFMEANDCLVPLTMIFFGWYMWKHHSKEANGIMGYRTKRSMRNNDTWKFANEYCGKLWYKMGMVMLIPSIMILVPFFRSNEDTIGYVGVAVITVQIVIMLLAIVPTERALKKKFPD